MLRVFNGRLFVIVLLACLAAACGDDDVTTTPIAPTLPKTKPSRRRDSERRG
jgi:hypothetical protein